MGEASGRQLRKALPQRHGDTKQTLYERKTLIVASIVISAAINTIAIADTSSPADDAIREAVVRHGHRDGELFDCVMVSETHPLNRDNPYTYLDPNPGLAARLRKQRLIRYLATDPKCTRAFWIGPVYREGNAQARVPVGMFGSVGFNGRPSYVLKKNWFGRWRVTSVALVE